MDHPLRGGSSSEGPARRPELQWHGALRRRRAEMVETQLARGGITNPLTLDASRSVPRECFVPDELTEFAYEGTPLPIGEGQTISQPYIVALTIDALELRGGERVLEVGTGSGYAAAVLSRIASEVYTMERFESLVKRLGYTNLHLLCADGSLRRSLVRLHAEVREPSMT